MDMEAALARDTAPADTVTYNKKHVSLALGPASSEHARSHVTIGNETA